MEGRSELLGLEEGGERGVEGDDRGRKKGASPACTASTPALQLLLYID
jgi:hypothetical protein